MNRKTFFAGALLLAMLAGCYMKTEHKITAHITIDIRQIKEVASNIEDMVSGTPAQTPAKEVSKPRSDSRLFFPLREAYAQGAQLKYLTDEIKQAVERRKSRYSKVEELLNEGSIGENNQGLLEIRQKSGILPDKELKDLILEENDDRMFIYRSILEQNNLPKDALKDIQAAFAKERQDRSGQGVWVQLPNGEWVRK